MRFTPHNNTSAVPAAHRYAAMPGRKSSTCKSLGSALCENCRSTRKLKCLNFGAAAAALAPLRAAESGAVMRRLQRRRRWLSLSTPLPATSGSPTRGWEVGSTLARRTLRSLAPTGSKTALLHASRQRADELRKASSQRAAGAAASRRRTRLAPWRCSRSWGVPAATPLLRRRRRTFSLSGASAIMLTSWCYSA